MSYRLRATKKKSKMGNKRTEYNSKMFDSRFEASVAYDLDMLVRSGDILKYDTQYRVDMYAYSQCLTRKMKMSHKVDFRVHHNDGRFTLLEAKGFETADYKMRAKWLDNFWLPLHPDHDYVVVYPNSRRIAWEKLLERK